MPIRVCTGFEFGPIATLAGLIKGNSGNRVVEAGAGIPNIVASAPVRTGAYALELNPSAAAEYVQWTTAQFGASQNRCVAAFAFQFPTLPTADAKIAEIQVTGATPGLWFRNSDDRLVVSALGGVADAAVQAGPVIVAGTWYYIELYSNASANPHTLNWWVDGVPQTQSTTALTAGTLSNVFLSAPVIQTMTCRYDDLVIWTDTVDITVPVGRHKVHAFIPDTAGTATQIGTANATGQMVTNSAIDATFSSANIIAATREIPPLLGAAATGVGQRTAGATNAVEIPMTTYTLAVGESIAGVRILVAGWAASATTNNIGLRVFNGTTEEILFAAADPNFDNVNPCAWLCKQVVGATMFDTQTKLNAMGVRLGYSTDINPLPGAHAIYAEVAIKQSMQAVAPEAVTATVTAGTLTVAGTSPEQDITPAPVTVTVTASTTVKVSHNVVPAAVTVTAAPGTMAISTTAPAQNVLPVAVNVAATPGTLAVKQNIAPAAVTITATGLVTVGQARKFFTESFTKADGAPLGADLDWYRHPTPLQGASQWVVLGNEADFAGADNIVKDTQITVDYLSSSDQLVTLVVTDMDRTTTGDYILGAGVLARFEPLNNGADWRGYHIELGVNNTILAPTNIWWLAVTRVNTTLTHPDNIVLLDGAAATQGSFTLPATLGISLVGDQITVWVDDAGTIAAVMAVNDAVYLDGRWVGLAGRHEFVSGDSGHITIDSFRAAIVQSIEIDPVVVTVTPTEIQSITGGLDLTQNIVPTGIEAEFDGGGNVIPPADAIDAGNTSTPPDDIIQSLDVVSVIAVPGDLSVAAISGQSVTPQATTVTVTPRTLTVTRGPVNVTPAPVTVTATPGVFTVIGPQSVTLTAPAATVTAGSLQVGDIVVPIPGQEIFISDRANTIEINDTIQNVVEINDPMNEVMVIDPGNHITMVDHHQSILASS